MRGPFGVKVAIRPVGLSRTMDDAVTGVKAGPGPVTVKLAALMVVGSIRVPEGTLKVALMVAVVHTSFAPAMGLVESTVTFAGGTGVVVVKVHT